jgi:hypothetical protein
MKKISTQIATIAALTAAIATTAIAQNEPVYSVNVIGMQKINAVGTSQGSFSMISMPFEQLLPSLDNVVGTNGVANNNPGLADQVLIFNPLGDPPSFQIYWLTASRKWASSSGFATNVYLEPGGGAWYLNRSTNDANLTVVGDVVMDPVVTNVIVEGLQMISYPYSSPTTLGALSLTNGVANNNVGLADQITFYDNQSDPPGFQIYWLTASRRWASSSGFADSVAVNPGQAFWYLSRSTNTLEWVEVKPYDL